MSSNEFAELYDNEAMNNQTYTYRTKIFFSGLTKEERLNVDLVFNQYSVTYKNSFVDEQNLAGYDLLCILEDDYEKNGFLLKNLNVPFMIVGNKKVEGCVELLKKSELLWQWLERVKNLVPPSKKPKLEKIAVGSVVRSKTTPLFGKGVVIELVSDHEVMVKFPTTKLLSKNLAIRCHVTQLQNLGMLNDLADKVIIKKEVGNEKNAIVK